MLHAISHKVALYFVAPVGGAAVATNFLQHRNPLVLLWGLTGLSFVLLANVHLAFLHARWLSPHSQRGEGGHPPCQAGGRPRHGSCAADWLAAFRPTKPRRPRPEARGHALRPLAPLTRPHAPSDRTRSTICCTSGTR